jgi:hypothetical protein
VLCLDWPRSSLVPLRRESIVLSPRRGSCHNSPGNLRRPTRSERSTPSQGPAPGLAKSQRGGGASSPKRSCAEIRACAIHAPSPPPPLGSRERNARLCVPNDIQYATLFRSSHALHPYLPRTVARGATSRASPSRRKSCALSFSSRARAGLHLPVPLLGLSLARGFFSSRHTRVPAGVAAVRERCTCFALLGVVAFNDHPCPVRPPPRGIRQRFCHRNFKVIPRLTK